jgi:hypothetical protein
MVDVVDTDSNVHASGFDTVGTITPDQLYDRFDVRRKGTLSSGTAYKRGHLLGKVTATGEWVVSTAAANDGSQDPRGVLLHDVDATAADAEGIIGRIGRCNGKALILGAGHTLASIDDALLDRGIILDNIIG